MTSMSDALICSTNTTSMWSGFAAPLVGKTAASIIGAGVGGFTAGVSGHLTGDVYDQLLNGKEGFDSFGAYMKSGAVGGAMGVATAMLSTLSVQSAAAVGETATTRTADAYAKQAPEHAGLFERVRAAGTKNGVLVKLKVSELADLINRMMGGPRGPGALQLVGGMDFRMLAPDAQVRVRLSADEMFNRPMEMSNNQGNGVEGKGASGMASGTNEGPAIKIESVEAEPVKTPSEESVSTPGDDAAATSSEFVDAPDPAPAPSPEAARLLSKGLPEKAITDVVTKFGHRGLQAVDRLVAEGVPGTSATKALSAAEKLGVADEVIDLVNSGKLKHPSTLRKLLEDAVSEGRQGAHGKLNELMEAKARADAGNDVSLGGTKFDPAKPKSGEADVVQYGAEPEAVQMKTISSETLRGVTDQLDYAVNQLKGKSGETPPAGAKRIARVLIENEKNPLFGADRTQLIESFKLRMESLASGDAIEIQVRNGTGEIKIQSSEIVP